MDSKKRNCLAWLLSGIIFVCINCILSAMFGVTLVENFIGKLVGHSLGSHVVSAFASRFIGCVVFTVCLVLTSLLLPESSPKNDQITADSNNSHDKEISSKEDSDDAKSKHCH